MHKSIDFYIPNLKTPKLKLPYYQVEEQISNEDNFNNSILSNRQENRQDSASPQNPSSTSATRAKHL